MIENQERIDKVIDKIQKVKECLKELKTVQKSFYELHVRYKFFPAGSILHHAVFIGDIELELNHRLNSLREELNRALDE